MIGISEMPGDGFGPRRFDRSAKSPQGLITSGRRLDQNGRLRTKLVRIGSVDVTPGQRCRKRKFCQPLSLAESVRTVVQVVSIRIVVLDKSLDSASTKCDVKPLLDPTTSQRPRSQKDETVGVDGVNVRQKRKGNV